MATGQQGGVVIVEIVSFIVHGVVLADTAQVKRACGQILGSGHFKPFLILLEHPAALRYQSDPNHHRAVLRQNGFGKFALVSQVLLQGCCGS